MSSKSKILNIIVVLCFLLAQNQYLFGQNYSVGYKKYLNKDYSGAENAFKIALNKRLSSAETARIHKMLGISQFMLGKRVAAEASFQTAKSLNPYINISKSEVFDDSVLTFFKEIKVVASALSLEKEMQEQRQKQETYLKIYSNIDHATISIDAVSLGKIDSLIKVSPGIHKVSLSAKGYKSVTHSIDVKESHVNNLTINLIPLVDKKIIPLAKKEAIEPLTQIEKKKKRKKEKVEKKSEAKEDQISEKKPKNERKIVKSKNRSRNKSKGKNNKPKKKPGAAHNLLPFGGGQYINENYKLGAIFSVSQFVSLAYATSKWLEAESLVVESDAEISKRDEERLTLPAEEQATDINETIAYQEKQQNKVNNLFNQSYIGFSIFGILWLSSTIEASLNEKESSTGNRAAYLQGNYMKSGIKNFERANDFNLISRQKSNWSFNIYPSSEQAHKQALDDLISFNVDIKVEF